jgi:pimeloyl-ACP methyl ester carboxylesterase
MSTRTSALKAVLLGSTLAMPHLVWAGSTPQPLPNCAQLATNPAYGLAGNEAITGLTAVIVPAVTSPTPHAGYCQVNFTDVSLSGKADGYLPGQTSQMQIQVGLPLSPADGGNGGLIGAWNQRIESLGNGGFAGRVVATTTATDAGYVGTGTDTGHNASIPSQSGALFGLNQPQDTVNYGFIFDFAWRAEHHANDWGQTIAKAYYGAKQKYNYFVGCSDGGREGHALAEHYPNQFDGIVSESPAVGWDRSQFSGGWGNYVANNELGTPGLPTAQFAAVNAMALAACDPQDGITDGLIQDTRRCDFDANAAVCGQPGAPAAGSCLTPGQATVVNKIWDGPRDKNGDKVWYGWERGVGNVLGITGAAPFPNLFGEELNTDWVLKNPSFDPNGWLTITEPDFLKLQTNLTTEFRYFSADNPDLSKFKANGGKMLVSVGNQDQVIPPRAILNYVQRLFEEMGGVKKTQDFYRFFVYPGYQHCQMNELQQFQILTSWVEDGIKPDYIVNTYAAPQFTPMTRKICMYPNVPVYEGAGSTSDEASFSCLQMSKDDPVLLQKDQVTGNLGNNGANEKLTVMIPPVPEKLVPITYPPGINFDN